MAISLVSTGATPVAASALLLLLPTFSVWHKRCIVIVAVALTIMGSVAAARERTRGTHAYPETRSYVSTTVSLGWLPTVQGASRHILPHGCNTSNLTFGPAFDAITFIHLLPAESLSFSAVAAIATSATFAQIVAFNNAPFN